MKKFSTSFIIIFFTITLLTGHDELTERNSNYDSTWLASHRDGIVKVYVNLGDYVKKGQLLFEQVTAFQEIDLDTWKEKVAFSKFVSKRIEKNKELIMAKKVYFLTICDVKVANAMLKKVKAEIDNSKYYAPFDGTVTKINCYDGSGLRKGDPEMEITRGHVKVDLSKKTALVCNREPGIVEMNVKLGQKVKKGQFLFKIKTNELDAQLEADLAEYEYRNELYKKNKRLNEKSVPLFDFIHSGIEAIEAYGKVRKDKLLIKVSSQYAPFDGVITNIYRYSGSGADHDKPIIQITTTAPEKTSNSK